MKEKLYPALQTTDACNKRCRACLRVPGGHSHMLRWSDVERYLADLKILKNSYEIDFQFVTGGEPTLWKEGEKDVGDILVALSRTGKIQNITLPTNGKRFLDQTYLSDLLERVSGGAERPIIIGLSIAGYQENFMEGRCLPLENLLSAAGKTHGKVLPVALVTLSRSDDMDRQIARSYPGVIQRVTPLAPLGGGAEMADDCPVISLTGHRKETLGDFLPHFRRDVLGKLSIPSSEFDSIENLTLMNRLSRFAHCGQSPFIDDRWHYCLPFRDDPDFDLAPLGEMAENTLSNFISARPFLQSIRTHGLLETVNRLRNRLKKETREKLDAIFQPEHKVSVAYRGCMICKELKEIGVWKDSGI